MVSRTGFASSPVSPKGIDVSFTATGLNYIPRVALQRRKSRDLCYPRYSHPLCFKHLTRYAFELSRNHVRFEQSGTKWAKRSTVFAEIVIFEGRGQAFDRITYCRIALLQNLASYQTIRLSSFHGTLLHKVGKKGLCGGIIA